MHRRLVGHLGLRRFQDLRLGVPRERRRDAPERLYVALIVAPPQCRDLPGSEPGEELDGVGHPPMSGNTLIRDEPLDLVSVEHRGPAPAWVLVFDRGQDAARY